MDFAYRVERVHQPARLLGSLTFSTQSPVFELDSRYGKLYCIVDCVYIKAM